MSLFIVNVNVFLFFALWLCCTTPCFHASFHLVNINPCQEDDEEDDEDLPYGNIFARLGWITPADSASTGRLPKPKPSPANVRVTRRNAKDNPEKSPTGADEEPDDPMGGGCGESMPPPPVPLKKRRSVVGTTTGVSEIPEAAAVESEEELTAEDRETLQRFKGLVKELKEMDPASSEEGQMQQWLKDCFFCFFKIAKHRSTVNFLSFSIELINLI